MLISLIVPCYNEEEAMPLFYQEAARVAAQMEKSHGAEFEIIFVDDGSKDGTLRVARELHDADPRVRYVSFSRNFGKEAGLFAGLEHGFNHGKIRVKGVEFGLEFRVLHLLIQKIVEVCHLEFSFRAR